MFLLSCIDICVCCFYSNRGTIVVGLSLIRIGLSISQDKTSLLRLTFNVLAKLFVNVHPFFIDNAGGHGTNDAIEQYRELLFRKYKVQLLHQVPNSPETNLLDLGVWRAIQSLVEKLSFCGRHDANVLDKTVQQAWLQFPAATVEKVYQRWLLGLDLIMKDNGGNRLVETHRGKLTNDPTSATNHNEADAQAAMRVTIEGENNDDDADDNDENEGLTIDGNEDFMMFKGAVDEDFMMFEGAVEVL